jgi:hypothetical protein
MFINENGQVFIKSTNIKVFPCGRRRSRIDEDGNANTVSDRYYIPFDPEARLNTEANTRKHSGLNGYKTSYIYRWTEIGERESTLTIVINGYLFEILLADDIFNRDEPKAVAKFGAALETALKAEQNSLSSIYAVIKLANIKFVEGRVDGSIPSASTQVLRDLSADTNAVPAQCLDQLILGTADGDIDKAENYYFSGLTFSSVKPNTDEIDDVYYLQLLDNDGTGWHIHEQSRLPKIDHGDTENSVNIPGDLTVEGTINADDILIDGVPVTTLQMVKTGDNTYQMQFSITRTKN